MISKKSPWSRAEKSLFLAPFVTLSVALVLWWQHHHGPPPIQEIANYYAVWMEFSPDGKRLAVVFENKKKYDDRFASVFDASTSTRLYDIHRPANAESMSPPQWSPDGTRLITGLRLVQNFKPTPTVTNVKFEARYAIWDAASGTLIANRPYAPPTTGSFSDSNVSFSQDGQKIVGQGQPITIFDAATGQRLRELKLNLPFMRGRRLNDDNTLLAISSQKSHVVDVLQVRPNDLKPLWHTPCAAARQLTWSKSNVLGIRDMTELDLGWGRLILWSARSRKLLPVPTEIHNYDFAMNDHQPLVAIADVEISDRRVAEGHVYSSNVLVWDYERGRVKWKVKMKEKFGVKWSPDGRWLAVNECGPNGTAHLTVFDSAGRVAKEASFESKSWWSFNWSPDSKHLAVNSGDVFEILEIAGREVQ